MDEKIAVVTGGNRGLGFEACWVLAQLCPGWVRTDMGGPSATRSVQKGVEGII